MQTVLLQQINLLSQSPPELGDLGGDVGSQGNLGSDVGSQGNLGSDVGSQGNLGSTLPEFGAGEKIEKDQSK